MHRTLSLLPLCLALAVVAGFPASAAPHRAVHKAKPAAQPLAPATLQDAELKRMATVLTQSMDKALAEASTDEADAQARAVILKMLQDALANAARYEAASNAYLDACLALIPDDAAHKAYREAQAKALHEALTGSIRSDLLALAAECDWVDDEAWKQLCPTGSPTREEAFSLPDGCAGVARALGSAEMMHSNSANNAAYGAAITLWDEIEKKEAAAVQSFYPKKGDDILFSEPISGLDWGEGAATNVASAEIGALFAAAETAWRAYADSLTDLRSPAPFFWGTGAPAFMAQTRMRLLAHREAFLSLLLSSGPSLQAAELSAE